MRIRHAAGAVPPAAAAERQLLARIGADPARIRLACQLRPRGDIEVAPLIPPDAAHDYVVGRAVRHGGEERFIAAMFVDLRDSMRLAETLLPYDSVFVISRFVSEVARAVVACGGVPNQFLGDGVLALFGLQSDPRSACRDALAAVAAVRAAVARLDASIVRDGAAPIRCGIGLHCGMAVVGQIGFGRHVTTTAIGDVVNVASRLQAMTRAFGCETIISRDVYVRAGGEPADGEPRVVEVRGRAAPIEVRLFEAL